MSTPIAPHRPLVVLMYHGLYADETEHQAIDAPDRPYAVSTERFAQQLQAIADAGLRFVDPATLGTAASAGGGVLLSFDDGHASNAVHGLPLLARHGAKGVFFVTSDFIERRPGFCSHAQVRELADAGMTVGSHGRTHRFLDDLDAGEARAELHDSRRALEDLIGQPVDQVSFPGGRYRPDQIAAWRADGYRFFHSSEIGVHAPDAVHDGAVLPRLAVRHDTSVAQCLTMARGDAAWLFKAQAVASAKRWVRRVAGNHLYHAVYERFHRPRG